MLKNRTSKLIFLIQSFKIFIDESTTHFREDFLTSGKNISVFTTQPTQSTILILQAEVLKGISKQQTKTYQQRKVCQVYYNHNELSTSPATIQPECSCTNWRSWLRAVSARFSVPSTALFSTVPTTAVSRPALPAARTLSAVWTASSSLHWTTEDCLCVRWQSTKAQWWCSRVLSVGTVCCMFVLLLTRQLSCLLYENGCYKQLLASRNLCGIVSKIWK